MSRIRQATADDRLLLRGLAVNYPGGLRLGEHAHDWDQLVHADDGAMAVETAQGAWIVPPQQAVWVPAGVPHDLETIGRVALRTVYLRRGAARGLARTCFVAALPPLLRALVVHLATRTPLRRAEAPDRRLHGVLLDQLATLEAIPLALPLPRDPRARRVADALRETPGSGATTDALARAHATSARTLERLFAAETGLSLGRWRQRLRVLHAIRRLAEGRPVTEVAFDVGYESPSAFVAAFRRHVGTTPGRYAARGRGGRGRAGTAAPDPRQ